MKVYFSEYRNGISDVYSVCWYLHSFMEFNTYYFGGPVIVFALLQVGRWEWSDAKTEEPI